MECYCCKTLNVPIIVKYTIKYTRCGNCGSIYTTDDITPLIETENDHSLARNTEPLNTIRIKRMENELGGAIITALDFGCGEGHLMNLMRSKNITTDGIDKGNNTTLQFDHLPQDSYYAISMIEVIEHLNEPAKILKQLAISMKVGGIIMIETTFADQIKDISLSTYVEPKIGHINVISEKGLKLVCPPELQLLHFLNPHVAILKKVSK